MSSITTLLPGASTVSPESSTSTQNSGIGLSTQLIIWGMVAFVLLELIAIFCLLRYCCRARYMKRRKFKEKEIILSDFAGGPPSLFNNKSSNMLETSHTHFDGSSNNISGLGTKTILLPNENQSMNSLRPILFNQTDNLNDTIMIDDIASNYAIKPAQLQANKEDSFDITINEKVTTKSTSNMKPTKSNEDIYTFRFSSQQPMEQFDPHGPIEQHSYLYNGSLNRPAFEIISHADIRPTTPIRFEHAKDLSIKLPKNNNKHYLDEFELIEQHGPSDFHYKQRVYDDGNFESSSWYSNKHNHHHRPHHHHHHHRSPQSDYRRQHRQQQQRSFTSPNSKLNYGNQESIHSKGKPVEWQMAREIRTTDWDRLKYYTDNTLHSFYERPNPNRYYSINELNDHDELDTNTTNNNYRTKIKSYKNEYSNSKPNKHIPTRKETTTSSNYTTTSSHNLNRNSSIDDKHSIMTSPRPQLITTTTTLPSEHPIGEQSKNDKKTLLDYYISSNSSDISSFNKLNLYKIKLIDNSNEIKNNININETNKKSDINENNLSEEWRRTSSSNGDGRNGSARATEAEDKRRSSTSTFLSSSSNSKPTILTKIIRDPDTNEILSKTRINEQPKKPQPASNPLDRSNISVIDVSYDNSSPRPNTFNLRRLSSINQNDEQDYEISETSPNTPLPPPLPFQFTPTSNDNNESNYTSIIPVNSSNNNNRLSPIASKENSNSSNYESSIVDSLTKHVNEDFQPSEILDISHNFYQTNGMESPDNNRSSIIKDSFNEKTKKILENKLTSNSKSGNIFQDIQSFDSNQLRPVKKKVSDSNYYDKIGDSSSNRSSSIVSNNNNNNNNNNNKYKPPSVIQSISSSRNDDKSSIASSSRLSKRSSQMY